jgi:hypothetical protein
MINPLVHYELEMTTRQQQQLQRSVALWQLAHQAATGAHRTARPNWLRIGLAVVTLVVGSAASANLASRLPAISEAESN